METKRVKSLLLKNKKQLIVSMVLSFIMVISSLSQPQIIKIILSEGITSNGIITTFNEQIIDTFGKILIGLGILSLVVGLINAILIPSLSQKFSADIRETLFNKIMGFSYQEIEQLNRAKLVTTLTNDVTQVQNFMNIGLQTLVRIPIIFIGSIILAIITMPSLWWLLIIYILIVFGVVSLIMPKIGKSFGIVQQQIDQTNMIVKENFEGARVIRSLVTEDNERQRYGEVTENFTKQIIRIGQLFSIMVPSFIFVANTMIISIFILTERRTDVGPEVIGSIVAYINYLMQIMFALIMGGFLSMSISRATISLKRINEVLGQENQIKFEKDNSFYKQSGKVEFRNVSFKYPNSKEEATENSIKNISFTLNEGEQVGIVGQSGSGKSTIAQLIARLYDVTEGEILIGDTPIKNIGKNNLQSNISYVMQKPIIFSGTIEDNIKYGNQKADDPIISEAALNAQAYEFISGLPMMYKAPVEQRGDNFSGGQRQRIAIARGLVKKSKILILDDSTSALDARSENLVKKALEEKYQGVTKIIIAQKVSSIINSDKIIVLKNGEIAGIGKHEELLNSSRTYQRIVQSQKGVENE